MTLIEPLLDRMDGICLSGGPDLDPDTYGQEPDRHLGPTEPDLDRFELAIASAADQRDLPILAICRGTQALNVVRGGTLVQHLPDHLPEAGAFAHRQRLPGNQPSHGIRLDPAGRLAATIGPVETGVNSFHHQAIDRLGRDLVRDRVGAGRHDRSDRGRFAALPDRGSVARGADDRPPRGAGAVPQLRQGRCR